MFKRLIHWRTYRQINKAAQVYDWQRATRLARSIGDSDLAGWMALARVVQVMRESEG